MGGHGGSDHGAEGDHDAEGDHGDQHSAGEHLADGGMLYGQASDEFDESYYMSQIDAHSRAGFIWQKLKEPRSYDYHKTTNKRYDERLRMPLFPFSAEEREAVVTFVLGLVAEPPAEEFVYQPTPRAEALAGGRAVLEKYNCGGCHILELDKWALEFQPGDFDLPPVVADYGFLAAHLNSDALASSSTPDPNRGVLRATVTGMQAVDDSTALPVVWDEEGRPVGRRRGVRSRHIRLSVRTLGARSHRRQHLPRRRPADGDSGDGDPRETRWMGR